jgi:Zn-dependent M28 family amino/carboxypeptidase
VTRCAPLLLALALLALAACDNGDGSGRAAAPPATERAPGARSAAVPRTAESGAAVTRRGLEEHLRALQRIADRNGGTRAAGTPGYAASVDYVAVRLREAGLRVRLQRVPFPFFRERSAAVTADGRSLRRNRDFRVLSYSGSSEAEGTVHAVGRGCGREDFDGIEDGGIALARRGDCLFRVKALNARAAGAGALLIVDRTAEEPLSATLGAPGVRIAVAFLGAEAARGLGPEARVRVAVDAVSKRRVTRNVIAETRAGEGGRVLMAGGHLDSVPAGPGINDNGSGVAALLEAAEALAARPLGERVRLAFWGAEELGLIGSRRYVRSLPAAERRRVAGYVNLDMAGSPNAVPTVYAGDPAIARALRGALARPAGAESLGGSSDHAPFDRAGIAVGGLYTGASEEGPNGRPRDPCYHRACDTLANVDRRVLLAMARAATRALADLSRQAK